MRATVLVIIMVTLAISLSSAEVAREGEGGMRSNIFFAPGFAHSGGSTLSTFQFGGGAEGTFTNGLGAATEVSYLGPWESAGDGFGILNLNGLYRFKSGGKVTPFVTGGYTLFFRSGHANGGNFGAGFDWWMKKHAALRLEFRDQIWATEGTIHYASFRIGFAFR